ncbi:Gfo/Idh/MocA family oxidoreductase [Dysgonomonas sp. 25]|uniref:Gfo/Idh/MocA family oxidoreductase n=1 Tax=Dysgonomonas sp. 25 TaxID=2302933 RepID=UPI00162858ED|nr:Gfo/Idh/MocA family oxidoreductase [Dysgonomonas sp. 25]
MKINVGLLAYGMSGKIFHAPFFDKHAGFNLYAITERTTKKAQKDYPSLISYDSIDELLNDESIGLVVVNTPNYLHYEHVEAALKKGKHVLVEKPFTPTVKQAQELFDLADKVGKKIFFYQNRRWDSDFLSIKKVIESGQLGKLNELHIRYDRYRSAIGAKDFKETAMPASGLIYDLAPHMLDQVISLFGKPLSYRKVLGKNRENTQVDDYFFIQLSYPDDLNVTVCSSLLVANPQKAFVLHARQGSYIKDRVDSQEAQLQSGMKLGDPAFGIEPAGEEGVLTLMDKDDKRMDSLVPSIRGSYLPLFDAVYDSIVHDKPYPVTREDILTQLEILES